MSLENFPTDPKPLMPYVMTPQWKTNALRYEDGSEERLQEWTSAQEKRTLRYLTDEAGKDTLLAFYNARKGGYEAFNFTCFADASATYTMRFDEEKCTFQQTSAKRWEVKLELVETNE